MFLLHINLIDLYIQFVAETLSNGGPIHFDNSHNSIQETYPHRAVTLLGQPS